MISINKKLMLLGQIKLKQRIMYNRATKLGRTHSSVISCSQELDILLNRYQDIQFGNKMENQYSKVS
jgi:stage 0 sporulation regulatory protein